MSRGVLIQTTLILVEHRFLIAYSEGAGDYRRPVFNQSVLTSSFVLVEFFCNQQECQRFSH